jgi:hypothetical protein
LIVHLLLGIVGCVTGCQAEDFVRTHFGGRNSNEAKMSQIDRRNDVYYGPPLTNWSSAGRP